MAILGTKKIGKAIFAIKVNLEKSAYRCRRKNELKDTAACRHRFLPALVDARGDERRPKEATAPK